MQESTPRTPHEQACGWRVAAVADDLDQILELETTTVGVVMAATEWSSPGASSSVDSTGSAMSVELSGPGRKAQNA